MQCGTALQEFPRPTPRGIVAVHCSSSNAQCPQVQWQCIVAEKQHTTHMQSSGALKGVPLPTALRHCGIALQEFNPPLPRGSVAAHCRNSTAHCPQTVWRCIAVIPLPTAPSRCGGALQEFHCPVPIGSVEVHCRRCMAHCPQAVWCVALRDLQCPLPPDTMVVHNKSSTARRPEQCGGTLHEFH